MSVLISTPCCRRQGQRSIGNWTLYSCEVQYERIPRCGFCEEMTEKSTANRRLYLLHILLHNRPQTTPKNHLERLPSPYIHQQHTRGWAVYESTALPTELRRHPFTFFSLAKEWSSDYCTITAHNFHRTFYVRHCTEIARASFCIACVTSAGTVLI